MVLFYVTYACSLRLSQAMTQTNKDGEDKGRWGNSSFASDTPKMYNKTGGDCATRLICAGCLCVDVLSMSLAHRTYKGPHCTPVGYLPLGH